MLVVLDIGISLLTIDIVSLVVSIAVGSILLKTTIAIRGMQKHALAVVDAVEKEDLDSARNHLSMIVKRDTKHLDKNHILSAVLESVSENTVATIILTIKIPPINSLFAELLFVKGTSDAISFPIQAVG